MRRKTAFSEKKNDNDNNNEFIRDVNLRLWCGKKAGGVEWVREAEGRKRGLGMKREKSRNA